MASHQKDRLASFLRKELGIFLLRDFPRDPEVVLSVANVILNSSAEEVKVYVSVFPESYSAEIFKELKFYRGEARKFISSRLRRRKIPKIIFLPAETEATLRLEKLLEKVKNEESSAK